MRYSNRALAVALITVGISISAAPASARGISRQLAREYLRAYHQVAQKFGHRAPGRNLVRWGLPHRPATNQRVRASLAVLHRMLAPPVSAPVSVSTGYTPAPAQGPSVSATGSQAPSGGLAACIISHESGGNPQATNGQYGGIGQWSPAAWAQDGGTKYSASPTGASYAQQVQVLNSEGAAGMQSQQGQYDGC